MGVDKYHDEVKALLKQNGEMGVNALSKALDMPLSTMQVYMTKQSYFIKTESRKWDLPERVAQIETKKTNDNFDTIIENQLKSVNAMFEVLMSNVKTTVTLLNSQKPTSPPVADKAIKVDSRLTKVQEMSAQLAVIIKKQQTNIPDEYKELLFNLDYIGLILDIGEIYATKTLEEGLYGLLAGKDTTLDEEFIEILKTHQIGE